MKGQCEGGKGAKRVRVDEETEKKNKEEQANEVHDKDDKEGKQTSTKKSKGSLLDSGVSKALTERITSFPTSFQCSSGELLYGQVACLIDGLQSTGHESKFVADLNAANGPVEKNDGNLVEQGILQHRVAARVGTWNYSRVCHDVVQGEAFVIHHSEVSPKEYVRRAALVGFSTDEENEDDNIVYLDHHHCGWRRDYLTVNELFGVEEEDKRYRGLFGGRLIVVDAAHAESFLLTAKSDALERECLLLKNAELSFGVHLADGSHDYEPGWLAFSGQKHALFEHSDELVAIVLLLLPKPQ
ncbi:hypothetical protein QOT17_023925 [Balamuthia mandrillaris]